MTSEESVNELAEVPIKEENAPNEETIKAEIEEALREEIDAIAETMEKQMVISEPMKNETEMAEATKVETTNEHVLLVLIGPNYQPSLPQARPFELDEFDHKDPDECLWNPDILPEEEIEEFLKNIRKQEWKGMNEDKILNLLHRCNYDKEKALKEYNALQYIPKTWTEADCRTFEKGLDKYGKQFHSIQKTLPARSTKEITKFYYVWKKTERYDTFMNSKPRYSRSRFRKNDWKKLSKVINFADHVADEGNVKAESNCTRVYCTRSKMKMI
ncbi:mesoderm induction early response protein 1 [Nephila pilipes]|uniref:Mesoderm induction early response protein 1 n=1 Tax=Nephila pilipes TaxID=299642 RepID=A0A8X6U6G0_NEPPI|nr:mesoderm induction early response protein 1 [Nephila pilipes]